MVAHVRVARLLTVAALMLLLAACGREPRGYTIDPAADLRTEYLLGDAGHLRVPSSFVRTSRYRLREDAPWLAQDSATLRQFQDSFAGREFEDPEIDIWIDSLSPGLLVAVMDLPMLPLDATTARVMTTQVTRSFEASAASSGAQVERLASQMKQTPRLSLVKLKFRLSHPDGSVGYVPTYVASTPSRSIIHELGP